MQLDTFTVELLFDDECTTLHFLDRIFDLLSRPFAEHGRKGTE